MSSIEADAIPHASPLILGEPVVLEDEGQRLLAAFVCLITCRVEFTDPATIAIPPKDRAWLMTTREPPANWQIWIGRYSGQSNKHWVYHHGIQIVSSPDEEKGPCNTQTSTFVIGDLCAHAFSSTAITDFAGYEGNVQIFKIWPQPQPPIRWGETLGVSDGGVIALAEALLRDTDPK